MKPFLTFFLLTLSCLGQEVFLQYQPDAPSTAEADNRAEMKLRAELRPPDPWRDVDGAAECICGPGFADYFCTTDSKKWETWGRKAVLSPGWFLFKGRVLEVQPLGIRVSGQCAHFGKEMALPEEASTFFVVNYPYVVAEGDFLGWHAVKEADTHTYTTVINSRITLRAYDYGIVTTAPAAAALNEEQIKEAKDAADQRKAEADAKSLKFDREQADKGDAYSERKMGERFRDGLGVPKNANTAKVWFSMAAGQGDKPAINELADLNVTVKN